MDIPHPRDRCIGPLDMHRGAHLVVIDDVMARAGFPNEDPLGKCIVVAGLSGAPGPEASVPMETVGIAGRVSHWGLDRNEAARVRGEVYLPLSQIPDQVMKGMAGGDQPVCRVRTMEETVPASVADRRFLI